MKKYYVRWGKYRHTVLGLHPLEACQKTMQYVMNRYHDEFVVPIVFCLSEKGFDDHDDDIHLTTHEIILMIRNEKIEDYDD